MRIRRVVLWTMGASLALAVAACSRVSDDWRSAQAADTTEAYQQFVQQHADSEFSSQAQARIKQLAEDRDWQQASTLDTRDAYEQFTAQHADGKWAQEARVRIENFQLATGTSASANATAAPPVAAAAPVAEQPAVTKPVVTKPAAAKPAAAPAKAASKASGEHYAQLGSFSSEARAQADWQRVRAKWPKQLGALKPHYVAGKVGGKTVHRLQVGLASREKAVELCAALKKHAQACTVAAD